MSPGGIVVAHRTAEQYLAECTRRPVTGALRLLHKCYLSLGLLQLVKRPLNRGERMSYLILFLKGLAMGAANVIPGVSGGTIALLTGVFERLVNAIKSFDVDAVRLLLKGRWQEFLRHTDFFFLLSLGLGVAVSIISLARLLEMLLGDYRMYTMAFFFGLVVASVWFVGKTVRRWKVAPISALVAGLAVAVAIALLKPSGENDSFLYLTLCGVAAICSMILPGLSGSFILLIMGNYILVLRGIYTVDLHILVPVAVGCVVGLAIFARILAWVFARYHDATIALMTGFITGSLLVIWPWRVPGETSQIEVAGKVKEVVEGYEWLRPEPGSGAFWIALVLMLAGAASVALMEQLASKKPG